MASVACRTVMSKIGLKNKFIFQFEKKKSRGTSRQLPAGKSP
jgi:hypothetical protein